MGMCRVGDGLFRGPQLGRVDGILNDDINQLERFLDGGANEIYQLVTTVIVIGASSSIPRPR